MITTVGIFRSQFVLQYQKTNDAQICCLVKFAATAAYAKMTFCLLLCSFFCVIFAQYNIFSDYLMDICFSETISVI